MKAPSLLISIETIEIAYTRRSDRARATGRIAGRMMGRDAPGSATACGYWICARMPSSSSRLL